MNRIAMAGTVVGIVRQHESDEGEVSLTFSVKTEEPQLTTPVKVIGGLAQHLISEHIGQGMQVLIFGEIEGENQGIYVRAERVSIDYWIETDEDE